jgi:2-enoate reductase
MDKKYSSLFEPLKIANLEIKNRIGMAPMAASGLINSDNAFDQRAIEYYVERAKGGAGLIITGGVEVENTIEQTHTGIFQNISTNPTAFKLTAVEMQPSGCTFCCSSL